MTESCSERQHLVSVRPAAGRAPQPGEINQFAKVTQSATLSRLDHKGPRRLPNAKNKSHDQQRVLTLFMDSECIFWFSFSIWVYISRVPELPLPHFSPDQTATGLPVKIPIPWAFHWDHSSRRVGPAMFCSHWEGEEAI